MDYQIGMTKARRNFGFVMMGFWRLREPVKSDLSESKENKKLNQWPFDEKEKTVFAGSDDGLTYARNINPCQLSQ